MRAGLSFLFSSSTRAIIGPPYICQVSVSSVGIFQEKLVFEQRRLLKSCQEIFPAYFPHILLSFLTLAWATDSWICSKYRTTINTTSVPTSWAFIKKTCLQQWKMRFQSWLVKRNHIIIIIVYSQE